MIATDHAFDHLAARVRISAPDHYVLDDTPVAVPATAGAQERSDDPALVRQLQHHLYERCYLGRQPGTGVAPSAEADLAPALAAANVGSDRWDPGWTIARINADGSVLVTREGRARTVWGGEYHNRQPGVPPVAGATVSVYSAHDAPLLQPGFYFALGDRLGDALEELTMLRLYWHVTPDHVADLLHDLVVPLRRYHVAFKLKALTSAAFYPRPDALVLYVPQRSVALTLRIVRDVHERCSHRLGDAVPMFARRLAAGLGLAEDPGNGESFGMSRCRVAAEGLWRAFTAGERDRSAIVRIVREHVVRYGLDPDRPWLNPGSTDSYTWGA
jgi:hypothetical protein